MVRARAGDAPVRPGLILGSGLGHLAGAVKGAAIGDAALPGFPHATVSGHNPHLLMDAPEGVCAAVYGGRAHYYETGDPAAMRLPLLGPESADRRADRRALRADDGGAQPRPAPTSGLRPRPRVRPSPRALTPGMGPSFDTPAKIRAIPILGNDAVDMSTMPEVILARFLGLKAAALPAMTNMAAVLSDEKISHEHTKAMAPLGAAKLERVLRDLT